MEGGAKKKKERWVSLSLSLTRFTSMTCCPVALSSLRCRPPLFVIVSLFYNLPTRLVCTTINRSSTCKSFIIITAHTHKQILKKQRGKWTKVKNLSWPERGESSQLTEMMIVVWFHFRIANLRNCVPKTLCDYSAPSILSSSASLSSSVISKKKKKRKKEIEENAKSQDPSRSLDGVSLDFFRMRIDGMSLNT